MSVQDAANLLISSAPRTEAMSMAAQIRADAEGATNIAAQCLGEDHLGTTAITGAALAVVLLTEQITEALGVLQFTMENVGQQVRQGGGSYRRQDRPARIEYGRGGTTRCYRLAMTACRTKASFASSSFRKPTVSSGPSGRAASISSARAAHGADTDCKCAGRCPNSNSDAKCATDGCRPSNAPVTSAPPRRP